MTHAVNSERTALLPQPQPRTNWLDKAAGVTAALAGAGFAVYEGLQREWVGVAAGASLCAYGVFSTARACQHVEVVPLSEVHVARPLEDTVKMTPVNGEVELRQEIAQLKKQLKNMEIDLESTQAEKGDLEQSITALKERINRLELELTVYREENEKLQTLIAEVAEADNPEQLKTVVARVKSSMSSLKQSLSALSNMSRSNLSNASFAE